MSFDTTAAPGVPSASHGYTGLREARALLCAGGMKNRASAVLTCATLVATLLFASAARAEVDRALDPAPTSTQVLQPQLGNTFVAEQVAEAAYEDDGTLRRHRLAVWGLDERMFLRGPRSTQVLFAADKGGKFLFIGIRGTWEFRDVLMDARLIKDSPGWAEGGRVHTGFAAAADGVIDDVKAEALAAIADGRRVIITGHSLGGAVAHILAFRLDRAGARVHSVITFGAPATGDRDWAQVYDQRLATRTFPWRHEDDPAPCVPIDGERWTRLVGERTLHLHDGGYAAEHIECADVPKVREIVDRVLDAIPDRVLDALPGDPRARLAEARAAISGFRGLVREVCKLDDWLPAFLEKLIEIGSPCRADVGEVLHNGVQDLALLLFTTTLTDHLLAKYEKALRRALADKPIATELFGRTQVIFRLDPATGAPVGAALERRATPGGVTSVHVSSVSADLAITYDRTSGLLKVTRLEATFVGEELVRANIGKEWNDVRHVRVGDRQYLVMIREGGLARVMRFYTDRAPVRVHDFTDTQVVLRRRPTTCDPPAAEVLDVSDLPPPDPSCRPKFLCKNGDTMELFIGHYDFYCEEPPVSAWIPCPAPNEQAGGGYDPNTCMYKDTAMDRARLYQAGNQVRLLLYGHSGYGFTYALGEDGIPTDREVFLIEPGFDTLEIYKAGTKTFLFALREADGIVKIHELRADGTVNEHPTFSQNWSQGWTSATFYKTGNPGGAEGTKPFVFLLKAGDGTAKVNKIDASGNVGATVWDGHWSYGWTAASAFRTYDHHCTANPERVDCDPAYETNLYGHKE